MLGCGSVAQCLLPLLIDHFEFDPRIVTILESRDHRERVGDLLQRGVHYVRHEITPENLVETLSTYLGSGDLLIDLAWNIDLGELLQWCRDHDVRYLNTSVEVWDPYLDPALTSPQERTLYWRHMALRRLLASWGDNAGPSAVVEHGANPGLVSHFTKQALVEIAQQVLHDGLGATRTSALEDALAAERYQDLAHALDVKVIHVSERDTQITNVPKQVGEFVNTWSVDGFYEEGVAPAEMGWGTHERSLPDLAFEHGGDGPRNQICLAQMAHKTLVRSRVPSSEIIGMVIRHGEAFTISDYLTVWEGDRAVYRPTVHYAYCPSDAAWASFVELEGAQYRYPENQRILNDDIISGRDELGVLVMGHPYKSWWTGMLTSIDEARRVAPHQSATTVQVAASILGAIDWMLRRPHEGVRVPDELPWRDVVAVATPYVGTTWSGPLDWDPLSTRADWFDRWSGRRLDPDDPWQFRNFLA
ncbi:MAG: saccharopine dehydrogenase NADP-binding domain-containing protein [Acidobacteriota bacterium]|nr:saccharopine dehydrogenase NADP-binding domain-containing protein [Acidobacteriota bacterium]MDE3107176.1 saccharopine dehydrogenase NADP-binding domain-containing protein [Acidobacteriota bacterium]MDE3221858.1 saccharopine dehydrogenase NADP-binding domain-containing protein [Acidobacteriota bacterium]